MLVRFPSTELIPALDLLGGIFEEIEMPTTGV
jgi:hypothetical protein